MLVELAQVVLKLGIVRSPHLLYLRTVTGSVLVVVFIVCTFICLEHKVIDKRPKAE